MLNGKSAIVTGSTSGIGLAIAQGLAARGVNVMINGFGDAGAIEAMRSRLEREHGIKAVYSNADMMNPPQVHSMVRRLRNCLEAWIS